jgi:hypothetical protein
MKIQEMEWVYVVEKTMDQNGIKFRNDLMVQSRWMLEIKSKTEFFAQKSLNLRVGKKFLFVSVLLFKGKGVRI